MLLLQYAVSAGFVCGFGVFECRVNQLCPSIRLVANDTSRRCFARARVTITGAGVWLVVDGNGWMWMQVGGAIRSYDSDVTLSSCSISYNTVTSSGDVSCLVVGGAA